MKLFIVIVLESDKQSQISVRAASFSASLLASAAFCAARAAASISAWLDGNVIELEALDAVEVPTEFVAVTLKVYAVDAVRPETVIVPDPDCETYPVIDTGVDVAVYLLIADPPLLVGAVKEIVALVGESAEADPIVGAPGAVTSGV